MRPVQTVRIFWRGAAFGSIFASIIAAYSINFHVASPESDAVAGACSALDILTAYGRLDDVGYRRAVKALTGAAHPIHDGFRINYEDMMAQCEARRNVKQRGFAAAENLWR